MAKKMAKTISLALIIALVATLLPSSIIVSAEGENDTSLAALSYTVNGEVYDISLTADDLTPTIQENRYNAILSMVTKAFPADKMPVVSATPTVAGANVVYTQTSVFPGTAKLVVTAADGTTTRNYYVRFKYEPGNIGTIYDKTHIDWAIATPASHPVPTPSVWPTPRTNTSNALHDLQLLNLTELREAYLDEYTGWEKYCRAYTDRGLSSTLPYPGAIGNTAAESSDSRIPSLSVPLKAGKTGDHTNNYEATGTNTFWSRMWLASSTAKTDGNVVNSTAYFNGASRIITNSANNAKKVMATTIDDVISFDIDRGAWVWVFIPGAGGNASGIWSNYLNNGWTRDATKNMYHADATVNNNAYKKHFGAGETVKIPAYGAETITAAGAFTFPGRQFMPFIVWDAPGAGNVSLNTLTVTYDDTPHSIDIVPEQTNYRVIAPSGSAPTIAVTTNDPLAEVEVFQPTSLPGSATVCVASGDKVATYTIDIGSSSDDSSLKTLTYTHPMMGTQNIALTPGVTTYNVVLPYGISSDVPQVTGEANHAYATIQSTTQAASLPGSASIVVSAEDSTTSNYMINFSVDSNQPVVDHLPGHISNVMTRYLSSTAIQSPVTSSNVYAVEHSRTIPSTKYDATTGYATNEERIAAAISDNNPYWTNDTNTWAFGDRPATTIFNGTSAPVRTNTQNVLITGTSPVLVGENVSRVLLLNNEKDLKDIQVPDFYSFTIDKAATIYLSASTYNGGGYDERYLPYGWKNEPFIKAVRGNNTIIKGADNLEYSIPAGSVPFPITYSKRYSAGANVTIPNRGMPTTTSTGMMLFVVWDECNANVALSDLKVNDTTIANFNANTTTYNVELPYGTTQVPSIAATPDFSGASVQVANPESLPGVATVSLTAADGVTTGSYTINYTIAKLDPEVTWPTVSAITYGQTFADAIGGGIGDGVFTIEDATVVPAVSVTPYTKTITFTPTDTETYNSLSLAVEITVNAPKYGDVNNDGTITISDVIMAAEIAVGYTNYAQAQILWANVSSKQDSVVDIADLILIIERVAGGTTPFPVELSE